LPQFFGDYNDTLLELVRNRVSRAPAHPDRSLTNTQQILEIGPLAMSGAERPPWEFVVVKDPRSEGSVFASMPEENTEFIYFL